VGADEAEEAVVAEAKRRHWRVQCLAGPQAGAARRSITGPARRSTPPPPFAVGASVFNLDVLPARRVLESSNRWGALRGTWLPDAEAWMASASATW